MGTKTGFLAITLAQRIIHLDVKERDKRDAPCGVELYQRLKSTRKADGLDLLPPVGPRPTEGWIPACLDVSNACPPDCGSVGHEFPRQPPRSFTHRFGR